MDRALRNVNDVAAVTSNRDSGYLELNNIQLAQEVQKLNGYNHFSSSTANLLEEVVRRLVCSQGTEVNFSGSSQPVIPQDPMDQPVTFGSTLTMRDIATAPYSVTLDPRAHLKKSQYPRLEDQLVEQGIERHLVEGYLDALKHCYNVTAICKQAPANFNIVFYWLANSALYWTWTATKDATAADTAQ